MSDDGTSPTAVGRQLARRRNDLDLTQDQLADRIGVRARTISAIERGNNSIQRSNRAIWEQALGLKPGTISRAYNEGIPIEPADADAGAASATAEPTLHELAEQMRLLREKIEEDRARDRQAVRQLEEEVNRLRGKRSG